MTRTRKLKKVMRKKRKGGAAAEPSSKPYVVGIEHCDQSTIDVPSKYVVDQSTGERVKKGVLKFVLSGHSYNPGDTFETTLVNIFRIGVSDENRNGLVYCPVDVNVYQSLMDNMFNKGLHTVSAQQTALPNQSGKMFENCVISNYDTTGHVDSTAGVYLYDNSDEHSDKSILIPVLLFDKTKLHSITLQYIASFIEVHFGQSLLYTIICRNYYGPNQNRARRNQKHVLVNTFGKVISF